MRAAAMYTVIGTAKLNDVDPQAWLADVLGRIADTPQTRLDELLPWNCVAELKLDSRRIEPARRRREPDPARNFIASITAPPISARRILRSLADAYSLGDRRVPGSFMPTSASCMPLLHNGVDHVLTVQISTRFQNKTPPETVNVSKGFSGCGGRI